MKNSIILALCAFTASQINAGNFKEEFFNFKGESFRFTSCGYGKDCPGENLAFMAKGKEWDQIVVNNKDGKRVAEASFSAYYDKNKCKLEWLTVLDTYRNRGIAKELFNRAIEHMINQGCRTIEWESLQSAVPFYKKMEIPDNAFSGVDPTKTNLRPYHGGNCCASIKYQVPFERLKNRTWSEWMKHKFH